MPKSGTTFLTYKIAANLNKPEIHFEPNSFKGLSNTSFHKNATAFDRNIITKCLYYSKPNTQIELIENYYDKKIWVVRDPRDRIISAFLYRWYYKHKRSQQKFEKTLNAVLQKERNPDSIPFYKIIECSFNLKVYLNEEKRISDSLTNLVTALKNKWFILKYEDLINGSLTDLENYLTFDLPKIPKNNFSLDRVKRTATQNNWKNWFTPEDVDLLKPIFQPLLQSFNYNLDWKLNEHQVITKQEGSEYLKKVHKPQRFVDNIFQKIRFILNG